MLNQEKRKIELETTLQKWTARKSAIDGMTSYFR